MIKNVLRGADPELFLIDKEGNPISSIGLIGGSKDKPRDIGGGYSLQEDNVAVEFNIPPAPTKQDFVKSIAYTVDYIAKEVGKKGLSLNIRPTAHFDKMQLRHPKAREMGCEPDMNAWTMDENPRPIAPESMRSAGGHLHLSWDNPDVETASRVVKVHDLFCSVPALVIDRDKDRRRLYGKAGACRFKQYGVEYRSLSNFWIRSKEMTAWLYDQSEKAIQFLNDGRRIDAEDFQVVQDCINTSNHTLRKYLTEKYNLV